MYQIKAFLKQHPHWVYATLVVVPLLLLLGMQYQSLLRLKKTMPIAQKMWMKNCLYKIGTEVKDYLKTNAETALAIPAQPLAEGKYESIEEHFKTHNFRGVKHFFVARFQRESEPQLLVFDPEQKVLAPTCSEQSPSIASACAPWKLLSQEPNSNKQATLAVYESDPNNRILLNPILNQQNQVVGVAGLVLDTKFVVENLLPQYVQKVLPTFFTGDTISNVTVSVYSSCGTRVFSTQTGGQIQEDYLEMQMPFLLTDYKMGIRDCYQTPEQWATWNFVYMLSCSVAMTLMIIGGVGYALRAANREVRLSNMKTEFVANVSHELRTPLSSIRVFGEFMKLGRVKDQEKIREYGEFIETESQRLTQLINNILDFSKIESGRKTYRYAKADMEAIIAETIRMYDVRLKQQGFDLIYEHPTEPFPAVEIDRDAITQAFMNLLDNAVKYSGLAKEILIKLEHRDGHINLSVTDHGIGIPQTDQDKIFEKFYRVSTGMVHDVKGSGLGLSIVKHIVEAHHGKVMVESLPSQGSTFTIQLPIENTEQTV
ncbi:MAG: HAMP domain-containing histidine kinase [Blastocatellia bacterium]|nr:HAMP domain-containing histidine kinase [Blastocatellia bacterium]